MVMSDLEYEDRVRSLAEDASESGTVLYLRYYMFGLLEHLTHKEYELGSNYSKLLQTIAKLELIFDTLAEKNPVYQTDMLKIVGDIDISKIGVSRKSSISLSVVIIAIEKLLEILDVRFLPKDAPEMTTVSEVKRTAIITEVNTVNTFLTRLLAELGISTERFTNELHLLSEKEHPS